MPTAFAPALRMRSRSPIGGTCCAISAMPWRAALDRHHRDLRAAKAAAVATGKAPDVPASASRRLSCPPCQFPSCRSPDRQAVAAGPLRRGDGPASQELVHKAASPARSGSTGRRCADGCESGQLPTWHQPSGGSAVDVHAEYLRRRWNEGCHNAAQLWEEIRERGFRGQLRTVQRWVRRLRDADPSSSGTGHREGVEDAVETPGRMAGGG